MIKVKDDECCVEGEINEIVAEIAFAVSVVADGIIENDLPALPKEEVKGIVIERVITAIHTALKISGMAEKENRP